MFADDFGEHIKTLAFSVLLLEALNNSKACNEFYHAV